MDPVKIAAALANPMRHNIMLWLKDPEAHFSPHVEVEGFAMGVCVGKIHEKSGMGASTISHFLGLLSDAELLTPTRIGKWTYYKRNEETIQMYIKTLI